MHLNAQDPSDPLVACIGCNSGGYADLYYWMVGSYCYLCCPRCYQVLTEGQKRSERHQHWRSGKHIPPEPPASPTVSEPQAPYSSPSLSPRAPAPVARPPSQPSSTLIPGSPNGAHGVPFSQRLPGVGGAVEVQGSKPGGPASGDCGSRKKGKAKGKGKS